MYLLIAERDSRNCRPASAKLPLSTTFTKARRLATLSMGWRRRLFPNRRHRRHICMDCLQYKAERYSGQSKTAPRALEDDNVWTAPRDRDRRRPDQEFRLLHPGSRPALRQEDGQFRRSRHLSLLLWRRDRPSRHHPDLLSLGRCAGRAARRRRDPSDRLPRAATLARLLDAALRREGHHLRGAGEALWRVRAALHRP